jgi:hypothetical protein
VFRTDALILVLKRHRRVVLDLMVDVTIDCGDQPVADGKRNVSRLPGEYVGSILVMLRSLRRLGLHVFDSSRDRDRSRIAEKFAGPITQPVGLG